MFRSLNSAIATATSEVPRVNKRSSPKLAMRGGRGGTILEDRAAVGGHVRICA